MEDTTDVKSNRKHSSIKFHVYNHNVCNFVSNEQGIDFIKMVAEAYCMPHCLSAHVPAKYTGHRSWWPQFINRK